jgi:hypothetical protein
MSIKRSMEEIEKKYKKYQSVDKLLDILSIEIKNRNIVIYNNIISNNIEYPLKKYKKTDENNSPFDFDNNKSHIKYVFTNTYSLFGFSDNIDKIDRIKINTKKYYSLIDIKLIKENQIKNIELINYEKIKAKLLTYYTLLNLLLYNNDILNSNIYKFITNDIHKDKKSFIDFHKTLDTYKALSINNKNNLDINFIKKILYLYSQYLLFMIDK